MVDFLSVRVTLIVGLPPRLNYSELFPLKFPQFSPNLLNYPQISSNFLSNSPFPPSSAGRQEQLMSPCLTH